MAAIPPRVPSLIDLSHHNGPPGWPDVDWDVVARQGFYGMLLKNSEGPSFGDKSFPGWWRRMREVGIPRRLAYHVPNNANRQAEADNFCRRQDAAGGILDGEGVMLDCEKFPDRGITVRPWDDIFWTRDLLNRRYGIRTLIYGGWGYGPPPDDTPWVYVDYRSDARMGGRFPNFRVAPTWWQWGGAIVPGIQGGIAPVDANVMLRPDVFNACLHGSGPLPGPVPVPQLGSDDVQRFVRRKDRQAVYLGDRIAKRWMKDPATYQRQRAAMAFNGVPAAFLEEHVVDTQEDLDLWGVTVGTDPGDV